MSDVDNFTGVGGMIGFLVEDNKVRFEINRVAGQAAGVTISSKLLSLAVRRS